MCALWNNRRRARPEEADEGPIEVLEGRLAAIEEALDEAVTAIGRERAEASQQGAGLNPEIATLLDAVEVRLGDLSGQYRETARLLGVYREVLEAKARSAAPTRARPDSPAPNARAPRPAGDGNGPRVSAGVRLLAMQMSVSGASRREIVARLRDGFGIADAEAVVSSLFGE